MTNKYTIQHQKSSLWVEQSPHERHKTWMSTPRGEREIERKHRSPQSAPPPQRVAGGETSRAQAPPTHHHQTTPKHTQPSTPSTLRRNPNTKRQTETRGGGEGAQRLGASQKEREPKKGSREEPREPTAAGLARSPESQLSVPTHSYRTDQNLCKIEI